MPQSIVVGFSIGIAVTIALSQCGELLGLKTAVTGGFLAKLQIIGENLNQANGSAMFLGLLTFVIIRLLLNVSIYIPAPLLALGVGTLLSGTMLASDVLAGPLVDRLLTHIAEKQVDLFLLGDRTNLRPETTGQSYEQFDGQVLRFQFQINY